MGQKLIYVVCSSFQDATTEDTTIHTCYFDKRSAIKYAERIMNILREEYDCVLYDNYDKGLSVKVFELAQGAPVDEYNVPDITEALAYRRVWVERSVVRDMI